MWTGGVSIGQNKTDTHVNYNAATGVFTSAEVGADSALVWNSNAAAGTVAQSAVILVGVTSAEAAVGDFAGGAVTFCRT